MPFFHQPQIDFYFEQSGDGLPLVFCHGLSGELTQMQEMLGTLPGCSLVLWDARGHGRTTPLGPAEAFNFPQFASDLHALLSHLGIERAVIGGVSMGAGVATRFALDWPGAVAGLVLVRPAWLDRAFPERLSACQQISTLLTKFGIAEARQRFEESSEYERLHRLDPEAAAGFCEQFDKPLAAERRVRLERIPGNCPIRHWNETTQLRMPTLVIGCEPDYAHPYAYAVEWSQRLPAATLVKVPPKLADAATHNREVRSAVSSFVNTL